MHSLQFETYSLSGSIEVLCLGAHCDDIEIGCGGTLLELASLQEKAGPISINCVVFSSNPVREKETRQALALLLQPFFKSAVEVKTFRNGFFPYTAIEIKEYFEVLKNQFDPTLIFTHYRDDRHQDHRLISDLTWNTFRDHHILEYEIPKYDGDVGQPSTFVEISSENTKKKTDILYQCFKSQHDHHWFSKDTFKALMRLRGIECNSSSSFAEAFYSRKTKLRF